jgi:ATPase subunit of ABC transporter with duplicated ATPase domains
LDRDALGGLATAIRQWAGAVVIISHNEEFVGALCASSLASLTALLIVLQAQKSGKSKQAK